MSSMGILQEIDNGVYVCICKGYYSVFKEYTPHAFVYKLYFSPLEKSECCVSIINNISYAPIFVTEEKDRRSKIALKNMIRKLFEGTYIVEHDFKVTANDIS